MPKIRPDACFFSVLNDVVSLCVFSVLNGNNLLLYRKFRYRTGRAFVTCFLDVYNICNMYDIQDKIDFKALLFIKALRRRVKKYFLFHFRLWSLSLSLYSATYFLLYD